MILRLEESIQKYRKETYLLLRRYLDLYKPLLLRTDLVKELDRFVASASGKHFEVSFLAHLLRLSQEAVIIGQSLYLAVRPNPGRWQYLHFNSDDVSVRALSSLEFLAAKERLVQLDKPLDPWPLVFDLSPFERRFPKLHETRSIGRGVEYLNRHLCSRLFDGNKTGFDGLLDFLKVHQHQGQQLMLNGRIQDVPGLRNALREALQHLEDYPSSTEWKEVRYALQVMGFEGGWGKTVELVTETMGLLSDVLEAPDPRTLESFLSSIPMIFQIVILSPHGYFGQSNVLGMPDTGGQVVYILDQVRALEKEMRDSLHQQGIEIEPQIAVFTRLIPEAGSTNCDQPIEAIAGTRSAKIFRVPFREENGEIIPHWISRFEIWPYLEQFAVDTEKEILAQFGGRPGIIIGNYSDGNLVASLLSHRMNVTQCTIAHALEKTKYLHSGLYWREHEEAHHFSAQFTADLISMNTADFIITSTAQEICGTKESVGQYESYHCFTMPSLFRVRHGIDVFDPKFNIVSPGADSNVFFPYTEKDKRSTELRLNIEELIYGIPSGDARGQLAEKDMPLIFVMSRLDRIKNTSGLLQAYAQDEGLRQKAKLFIVGGQLDPARSNDEEERFQIERMHEIFDEYQLDREVRWVVMQSDKELVGELYRFVADTRGVFVQPALFEAFGLTVIEAMTSGLPTFATCYGGPLEIIQDGISGFHIDPNEPAALTATILQFLDRCVETPGHWDRISQGALLRVERNYTWKLYAKRLLALSRIYGFWKHISDFEREETRCYLDMFYSLMHRPMAARVARHTTSEKH